MITAPCKASGGTRKNMLPRPGWLPAHRIARVTSGILCGKPPTTGVVRCCDNFLYILQGHAFGAPEPGPTRPKSRAGTRKSAEGNPELERGRIAKAGRVPAGRAYSAAAACRALRAEAHRARRCRWSAALASAGSRYRLQRAPGCDRVHATDRAVLPAPGILSPCKDHRQERSLRSRPSDGATRHS